MKRCYNLLIPLLVGFSTHAQVGINTSTPKSTLDVQVSTTTNYPDGVLLPRIAADVLKSKESSYDTNQDGAMVYVTSPLTSTVGAEKTLGMTSTGIYYYEALTTNTAGNPGLWVKMAKNSIIDGTYAARGTGNLSLVSLGITLLGSNVNYLSIPSASNATYTVDIASSAVASNMYTVPSTGIYHINYSFRTGQGVSAELLSGNRPGVVIVKTVGSTTTVLDSRMFGSVNLLDLSGVIGLTLVVANVALTQGQISHMYQLNAGDIIRFGIVQGGLNLGLITDKSAEISIYKIR